MYPGGAEEEGIYLARIDMDLLRDYREHEVMGGNTAARTDTGYFPDRPETQEPGIDKLILI